MGTAFSRLRAIHQRDTGIRHTAILFRSTIFPVPPMARSAQYAVPMVTAKKADFHLNISDFPQHLQEILNTVDDDKNGKLEGDELEEMIKMFAAMKEAAKDGSIALATLPKEIQPSLKVFDVDGDGSVAPLELARAAELYADSKNNVKKLKKAVGALIFILLVLMAGIGVMTTLVIEASKETSTASSGITTVKGSDTPTAVNGITNKFEYAEALTADVDTLNSVTALYFEADELELSYTITGWSRTTGKLTLFSARGDTIVVTADDVTVLANESGAVLHSVLHSAQRHLLGRGGFLAATGSFRLSGLVPR